MKRYINFGYLPFTCDALKKGMSLFLSFILLLNSHSIAFASSVTSGDLHSSASRIDFLSLPSGILQNTNLQYLYIDQSNNGREKYIKIRESTLSSKLSDHQTNYHIEIKTGYGCDANACITVKFKIDGRDFEFRKKIFSTFKDGQPGSLGSFSANSSYTEGKTQMAGGGFSSSSRVRSALSRLDSLNSQLQAKNQQLASKSSTLRSKNEDLKKENSKLEDRNQQLSRENSNLSSVRSELERTENDLQGEIDKLNDAIRAMRDAGKAAEEAKQRASNSKVEYERLQTEKEKVKKDIASLKVKLDELKLRLEDNLKVASNRLEGVEKQSEKNRSNKELAEKYVREGVSNHNKNLSDIDQVAQSKEGVSRLNKDLDAICKIDIPSIDHDFEKVPGLNFSASDESHLSKLQFGSRYIAGARTLHSKISDKNPSFEEYQSFAKASLDAADKAFSTGKESVGNKLVDRAFALIDQSISNDSVLPSSEGRISEEDFAKNAPEVIQDLRDRRDATLRQIDSMDHYKERKDLIDYASHSIDLSQDYFDSSDVESSWTAAEIARTALDFATSFTPGVSLGRDVYEAVTGRDLISRTELDTFSRSMAILGVVTAGFGSKIGKGIKALAKLMKGGKVSDAVKASEKIDYSARKFDLPTNSIKKFATDLANPPRRSHILHGELKPDGSWSGGHLYPGKPEKTVFPQSWSGDKIMHETSDIVTDPKISWDKLTGTGGDYTKTGKPARFKATGLRDGITIEVVIEPAGEGIITAYPKSGPGVFTNPKG